MNVACRVQRAMTINPTLSHRRRRDRLWTVLEGVAPRLGFTTTAVDRLSAGGWIFDLKAGRVLFAEGDVQSGTVLVLAGVVELQCGGDQVQPVTLDFVGSTDVFGMDWFQEGPASRLYTAIAKTDALVAMFDRRLMHEVFEQLPPENRAQLWLSSWSAATRRLVAWAGRRSLPAAEALVQACMDLAPRFGLDKGSGTMINLALTRADLAALVGASEWTVRRTMPTLGRAGDLVTEGHRIVLSPTPRSSPQAPARCTRVPTYDGAASSRARPALRDMLRQEQGGLGFTAHAAERFAASAAVVHVRAGSLLHPPGRDGDVGVMVNADGVAWLEGRPSPASRPYFVELIWARRWFRLPPVASHGMDWVGARAHVPCDVAFLPITEFEEIVSALPVECIRRVAALTSHQTEQAACALSRSSSLPLTERLLGALRDLARERSRCWADGTIELTIPLHDADLGLLIGHRREGANRGLRELAERGWIRRIGTTVLLCRSEGDATLNGRVTGEPWRADTGQG